MLEHPACVLSNQQRKPTNKRIKFVLSQILFWRPISHPRSHCVPLNRSHSSLSTHVFHGATTWVHRNRELRDFQREILGETLSFPKHEIVPASHPSISPFSISFTTPKGGRVSHCLQDSSFSFSSHPFYYSIRSLYQPVSLYHSGQFKNQLQSFKPWICGMISWLIDSKE